MSDEEFMQTLRMVSDAETVHVAHLKDIAMWLRDEGSNGKYMDPEGLTAFAEALANWLAEEASGNLWRTLN